nr:unnamed protein product [Spirometra erinaceieuropaei]
MIRDLAGLDDVTYCTCPRVSICGSRSGQLKWYLLPRLPPEDLDVFFRIAFAHFNIAGKIFARILLNLLNNHLEQGLLPESQCDFRRHRGTTDMIFPARQLQEKCQEMRTHLYSTFKDMTKALDMVNRAGLWKIMQKFGYPERFTQMVRQLHDGMMTRVTDNGAVSEAFAVSNGVK